MAEWRVRDMGEQEAEGVRQMQETLKRMDELREELAQAERRLESLREASTRTGALLGLTRCRNSGRHSRIEHAVISGLDLEAEVQELRAELGALVAQVTPMTERLKAGNCRVIVRLRFLDGLSCAAIAWRLHYSRSYVYKVLTAGMRRMLGNR